MAGEELVDLKFRLYDGTDIGPNKYAPATTIGTLKEIILSHWPQDKENAPKTINDMKLINAGKILENNKTLAESRVPVGDLPGGVITMHVVVRPPSSDKNSANFNQLLLHSNQLLLCCKLIAVMPQIVSYVARASCFNYLFEHCHSQHDARDVKRS